MFPLGWGFEQVFELLLCADYQNLSTGLESLEPREKPRAGRSSHLGSIQLDDGSLHRSPFRTFYVPPNGPSSRLGIWLSSSVLGTSFQTNILHSNMHFTLQHPRKTRWKWPGVTP